MKANLAVFALSAIMIAGIGMAPAFGQAIQGPITVTTDKSSYSSGEIILITGQVRDLYSGTPVTIQVIAPNGNVVVIDQLTVGTDKGFSAEVTAGGSLMKIEGSYTINVQYGQNHLASTAFDFGGTVMVDDPVDTRDPNVTDTTVLVEGADDLIGYEITGGKLLNIIPDVDGNSLIISIEATEDGTLTLTIPRTVFDSVNEDGEDKDIIVLVDLEESDYEEVTTPTDRTVAIQFSAGAEEIEIIGTFVIPEFGTIAAMILAVAIISIIAISARSRLSIIPRY